MPSRVVANSNSVVNANNQIVDQGLKSKPLTVANDTKTLTQTVNSGGLIMLNHANASLVLPALSKSLVGWSITVVPCKECVGTIVTAAAGELLSGYCTQVVGQSAAVGSTGVFLVGATDRTITLAATKGGFTDGAAGDVLPYQTIVITCVASSGAGWFVDASLSLQQAASPATPFS